MLKLFVCRMCGLIFPSKEKKECPECSGGAVETDYFLVDLMEDNAGITRKIYKQYGIAYEEFSDIISRTDTEETHSSGILSKLKRVIKKEEH